MTPPPGILYVVGTPIGNLEDMTFRAVRILQTVDLIAAEDTRHTGKLLQHFQVKTPMISYHEHNQNSRIPDLLVQLVEGKNIALVSDAGIPGISDPGYELVRSCVESALTVVPIPGPSAAITALCASGLPTERFVFEGFLPSKSTQRREYLTSLQTETRTLIFYESPHRLRDTLADLAMVCEPERRITIARELTKLYEEFWHGTIFQAIAVYQHREPQGEYTLIVAGNPPHPVELTEEQVKAELLDMVKSGVSRSQASRQLAEDTGLSRRYLYQLALGIDFHSDQQC